MDRRLPAVLLSILLILLFPRTLGAHVARLTAAEVAAASANVVVAVVEGREVRWNGKHTLLMTDYTLRIEDRLRGQAPEHLTLTMPGGTLGDISDEVCTAVDLAPGARYLLFLGGLDRPGLSPVVGARQGAFRETPDFQETVAAARDLVDRTPLAPRQATAGATTPLPAKTWVPLAEPFVYTQPAHPPIEVNPLPAGNPFSPVDQERMAYWNLYAGDLFRVSESPTATWSYGNGRFDLAGFPDDRQMTDQFEVTWGEIGEGVLGVAFVRRRDGAVIESDVALNPLKVEVYLAPQRLSFEGAVRVKTLRVPGTLASGATRQLSVGKLQIPGNLSAGTYWLAYFLRDSKDAFQANNSAWSNYDLTLTVTK